MTQLLPEGAPSAAGSLTPGRRTRALFDRSETVVVESGWGGTRSNSQIAPVSVRDKGADTRFSKSMYLWSSGCYTLRPLQMDISKVREYALDTTTNEQFIYKTTGTPLPALVVTAIDLLEYSSWKEPIGIGITSTPGRNANGDRFYRKKVSASGTWIQSVAATDSVAELQASVEADLGTELTQPIEPLFGAAADQPADQGYCLRWAVPGTAADSYDVVGAFHFAEQYALVIGGGGDASLWEYARLPGAEYDEAFFWQKVMTFRYCNPSRVSGFTHKLLIFPTLGPNGEQIIHFQGTELENNEPGADSSAATPGGVVARALLSSNKERVYQRNVTLTGTRDEAPGHATKAGPMFFQVRRDIRIEFQISRLVYPLEGKIYDQPWEVPPVQTPRPFDCTTVSTIPAGTDITPVVKDAVTDSTVTITKAYVVFTFTSDSFDTPRLWSYKLRRAPVFATSAPGSFTTSVHGTITCQDGGADTRRAGGSLSLHDVFGQYPRLRKRGFLPVTLYTDFQPPAVGEGSPPDPVKVVLFKGYAVRPHWTRRGRTGRSFPEWHEHDITLSGMWYRLTKPPVRGMITWANFAVDPDSAQGYPYKVTDAVRVLLDLAGFPPEQINIPDNPIRLFPGIGTEASDLLFDASTTLAEMIARLLQNYLGATLFFDDSAGDLDGDDLPVGQWTILFPPKGDPASGYPDDPPPTPVLNFVTTGPVQGETGYRHPGMLASYPEATVPCFGNAEGWTDPPEANHVWVISAPDVFKTGGMKVTNHAYNARSYQVPGWTAAPDPESPHYVGMEWPVLVADPTLWGGSDLQDTQKTVDFLMARAFNYTCLARELQAKHGPLVFVLDADTEKWRKPRHYDPVTVDGEAGWYIDNVQIAYRRDRTQMATYELARSVPYGGV